MIKIGFGNTADVYRIEDKKICKLFHEGYPLACVKLEFDNTVELYKNGVRVPKPYEITNIDGRIASIYEEIAGKTIRTLSMEKPSDAPLLFNQFIETHKKFLSHHSHNLLSYKKFLISMISNDALDLALIDEIEALPDGDYILHGDFHPDNVILSENGELVTIDCMNACYGPRLFDISRTFFLIDEIEKDLAKLYLDKMNVTLAELKPFISVIKKCRPYES